MDGYTLDNDGIPTIDKTVPGVLDYTFDWSEWLAEIGDTIAEKEVTAASGITLDKDERSGGKVIAWLSGGAHGFTYWVRCRITTTGGRTEVRTIRVRLVLFR